MHSHYPLPTIEEVTTCLTNAKVFSVLDAKTRFCQVKLEEASSYLTTFNTSFGRYRWRRMPFGISSVPEVWQQRMNEIVEGLDGVEVIAGNFLICEYGTSTDEAIASHDTNLCLFLDRAKELGLKLNPEYHSLVIYLQTRDWLQIQIRSLQLSICQSRLIILVSTAAPGDGSVLFEISATVISSFQSTVTARVQRHRVKLVRNI